MSCSKVASSQRAYRAGTRASCSSFSMTVSRQQSQRVRRSTPSTVTLFQRDPWQISQSIAVSVQVTAKDAVLAQDLEIARHRLGSPAGLPDGLAAPFILQVRGKIV